MKVIAVGNMKGGVGKTTIAVHLACEIAARNHQVLLIDMDEQGTSSDWHKQGKLPVQHAAVQVNNVQQAREFIHSIQSYQADIAVLDLPPHTHESTEAALWISDVFVIPVLHPRRILFQPGKRYRYAILFVNTEMDCQKR